MEINKHYLIENFKTNKFECFKILEIADSKILTLKIPTNEKKEMNKDYAMKHAQPCPISDDILPYFGFHRVDNSPAFNNENNILVKFLKIKGYDAIHAVNKVEFILLGYAKISKEDIEKTNLILSKNQDDDWEQIVRENYKLMWIIDEIFE